MALIFRAKLNIPEIDSLDKRSQKAVLKQIEKHCTKARNAMSLIQLTQLGLLVLTVILTLSAVWWVQSMALADKLEGPATIVVLIVFPGLWMLATHLLYRHGRRKVKADVEAFFDEHWPDGSPLVCLNCGYDLRVATSGSCPECGQAIPNRATTMPAP